MVNYVLQSCESAIVTKPAFSMRPETIQRESAVSLVRCSISLEVIDSNSAAV